MSALPVADDKMIYFSTAYGKSKVMALKHHGATTPEVAWENNKNAPKMCSPLLHDGLLYAAIHPGGSSDSGSYVYRWTGSTWEQLLPGLYWKTEYRFSEYDVATNRNYATVNNVLTGFSYDSKKYDHMVRSELVYRFNMGGPVVAKY